MRHVLFLSLFLSTLFYPNGEALAEGRALIILGDFDQWVDLIYNFDHQKTETKSTSSRTQHYFKEEYHIGTSYAIWDPRILRGKLRVGLGLDQNLFSASKSRSQLSSGTNFDYSLSGALLERSPYPLHFFSQSEYIHAQREFASSYDINVDRNGFIFLLKNRLLPVRFDYTRTTTETSGLGTDQTQTSDTFSVNLTHKVPDVSDTEGQLALFSTNSRSKNGGLEVENRTSDLSLRNQLHLSRRVPGRILSSGLQVREEAATLIPDSRIVTFDEQFVWPMGKALITGASYLFSNRDSSRGADQHQNGRVWLQHRLFESLSTQLNGDFSQDSLTSGKEENVAGSLDLVYQKRLFSDSQLQLNYFQQYQITDRTIVGSTVPVLDESHTAVIDPLIPGLFTVIPLRNPDVVPESIVIRNADPRIRLLPYVENSDYSIQRTGLLCQIVILPGSEINAGDILLISYSFLANPQAKYSTNSRRVGFNLMLFRNAYLLNGSWFESQQDLMSGRANNVRLVDQKWYKLGFEANRINFSYGAEYENYDSDLDRHQTILGFVRYTHIFGLSSLALYTSDAYTITKPVTFTGYDMPERKVTTLSTGGVFNTLLFSTAQLLISAKYINLRGDTLSRDDASLGFNLRWNYGKIALSILSQINWRMQPGITTENEYIRLHLTRYF
jgi:hypothetical protein